jgi:hypothetical protein
MDGGKTDNEPSGEQEEQVAPPGWYADPDGAPVMRLWDGKRWTLEGTLCPTPEVAAEVSVEDAESSPARFNWPALVASTLVAVGFVVSWLSESGLGDWYLTPVLVMLFGGLGADPKYGSGPGHFVALVLAVAAACLVAKFWIIDILGLMWGTP